MQGQGSRVAIRGSLVALVGGGNLEGGKWEGGIGAFGGRQWRRKEGVAGGVCEEGGCEQGCQQIRVLACPFGIELGPIFY